MAGFWTEYGVVSDQNPKGFWSPAGAINNPTSAVSLKNGLVSYWRLHESGTSTPRWDTHGSNHFSPHNNPSSLAGLLGPALDLESTSASSLRLTDNPSISIGANSFAFTGWFKMESTGSEAYMTLIGKDDVTSSGREHVLIYQQSTARFSWNVGRPGTMTMDGITASNFGAPSVGQWYFFYVGYDRDLDIVRARFGVAGGSLFAEETPAAKTIDPPDSSSTLIIGRFGNDQFAFDGLIQHVTFHKGRDLTTAEIEKLFNNGAPLPYERFEEDSSSGGGGGPTTYNDTISEVLTLTDSQSASALMAATRSEPLTVSDNQSSSALMAASHSEILTVSDAQAAVGVFGASITEAVTITDSQIGGSLFSSSLTEALSVSESISASMLFSLPITETLSATDSQSSIGVFGATITESVTVADSLTSTAVFNSSISETVNATDNQIGGSLFSASITEVLNATDSVSATAVFSLSINETVSVSDAFLAGLVINESVVEALSASDLYIATLSAVASCLEALTITEEFIATGETNYVCEVLVDKYGNATGSRRIDIKILFGRIDAKVTSASIDVKVIKDV
jgi:hypothetical protein